jgi:hypothetical protein
LFVTQLTVLTFVAPLAQSVYALCTEGLDPFLEGSDTDEQDLLYLFQVMVLAEQQDAENTFCDAAVAFLFVLSLKLFDFLIRQGQRFQSLAHFGSPPCGEPKHTQSPQLGQTGNFIVRLV